MLGSKRNGTVIAEGLKIIGSVTAEGLVQVNGQIEGELHCTSLIVSPKAQVAGTIIAERVVVDGRVDDRFKGEKWCSSRRHMSSVTSIINLLPWRRAPTSRAAQSKPPAPMDTSLIDSAKSRLESWPTVRRQPDPFRLLRPTGAKLWCHRLGIRLPG